MYKPAIGQSTFKPAPTKAVPDPFLQPCIVCAVYENGIVSLVTWDELGTQKVVQGASIVQATDTCPAHYEG